MTNRTIITKHSTTVGAVPLVSNLEVGELAVNTADAKLFTKHSDGSIVSLTPDAADLSAINQDIKPAVDNMFSLGSSAMRMATVYAGTSAINTSDEREKQEIGDIPQVWLEAWGDVQYQRFRFRDAVSTKGDSARIHIGLVAQRVKAAFESRGIDPFSIGILCWDAWEESTTEDGKVIPAGDRYGIRYEEALALECAYLRQQLSLIKK